MSGISVYNNIFYNSNSAAGSIEVPSGSLSGFTSDYNIVVNSFSSNGGTSNQTLSQWQSSTGQDLHSIIATPSQLFVNPTANNYQELSTSPSIGAGTSTDAPSTDILGESSPEQQRIRIVPTNTRPVLSTPPAVASRHRQRGDECGCLFACHRNLQQGGAVGHDRLHARDQRGAAVTRDMSYNSSTETVTFTPSSALAYSTNLHSDGRAGPRTRRERDEGPVSWSFTTDPLQPACIHKSPASGATGVAVSPLTATFNEAVQSRRSPSH